MNRLLTVVANEEGSQEINVKDTIKDVSKRE